MIKKNYEKTLTSDAYTKLSKGRSKIDRGIWPVILLKLKSLHQWDKEYQTAKYHALTEIIP